MKAIHALALAALTGAAQAGTVYDNFELTKWVVRVSPAVHVFEHAGRLRVDLNKGVKGEVSSGGYYSTCKLTGDFDVSTEFYLPEYPAGNGVRVGLMLNTTQTNGVGFDTTYAAMQMVSLPDGTAQYAGDLSNYGYTLNAPATTSNIQGKLRLKRAGQTLTAYFWDGPHGLWVPVASSATFTAAPVYFGLTSWTLDSYFGDMKVRTAFDNPTIDGSCTN